MKENLNINTIQYVSIIGSAIFIIFILGLIRKRKIGEEYSLLWLFFGVVFFVMSIWRYSLEIVATLLGIAYAPAALFIIMFACIISILIHYSIVITSLSNNINLLVQELGLVKMELKELKEKGKK